jgi:hypothetical protein
VQTVKHFEAGKTYFHRWIGDADLISNYKIDKRTASSIWIRGKRFKVIHHLSGYEFIFPCGRYSMAPVLNATNEVKDHA